MKGDSKITHGNEEIPGIIPKVKAGKKISM
jgi:hypothetical protein